MAKSVKIDKIFQPFQAIRNDRSDRFVGRKESLVRLLINVQSEGGAIYIIGERGVGKTSLAWKLQEVVSGSDAWLEQNGLQLDIDQSQFDAVWIECTPFHENLLGLIYNLLNPTDSDLDAGTVSLSKVFADAVIRNESLKKKLGDLINDDTARAFQARLQSFREEKFAERLVPFADDLVTSKLEFYQLFREVVSTVSKSTGRKIFVFFDELDRLPDRRGLGDFVKSGKDVRFALVGVGDTIDDLVKDHPSVERKLIVESLAPMSDSEVTDLFSRANNRLKKFGASFSLDFIRLAVRFAGGFPYMAQQFGHHALVDWVASGQPPSAFGQTEFQGVLKTILRPEVDTMRRHDRVSRALQQTGKGEILRELASAATHWLSESRVRSSAKYRFDGNLNSLVDEGLLVKRKGEIRFFDPMVRATTLMLLDRSPTLSIRETGS